MTESPMQGGVDHLAHCLTPPFVLLNCFGMSLSLDISKQLQRASEDPIFDLEPPPREPLDEEVVRYCIYNDLNQKEKKTAEEEEWDLRMTCTQEWFIRCSSINKFLFIDKLLKATPGLVVLENVLKSIDTILSKDVLESLSRDSSNFAYDKILADDNRALDEDELNSVMADDFTWFVNLDTNSQLRVVLRLLRLSGGGFIFVVNKMAEKLFVERQKTAERLRPPKRAEPIEKNEGKTSREETEISVNTDETGESLKEFVIKRQTMMDRRESEFIKYKKMRGLLDEDARTTKEGEVVDYLQILPISLNRRIMSYIDEKTLLGFKKVGKYWSKMIDESINEKSGRRAINARINKIIGIKADKEARRREDSYREEELKPIRELGVKALINAKNENERALLAMHKNYKAMFSRKCKIKTLDSSFHSERCGAFDSKLKILACSSPSNLVHFYSLKTGARFDFLLFGLESPVTCLAFHENKTHIFIGCRDGSLLAKDFRTNRTIATFNGHASAVLCLYTASVNFLSASEDNTVRYFRLWSGICLLCVDLNPELHVMSCLLRRDPPHLTAIGTREGILTLVNLEKKEFMAKIRLYSDGIEQLAHVGDLLVTGSSRGKIRIWNMNRLEINQKILQPYFNLDVDSCVRSLKIYQNQIFCGCENGTLKIIPLVTGRPFKSLKIASQTPITGLDVIEDRPHIKLMIWHENGVEIREFSMYKTLPRKFKETDRWKSRQRASKETESRETLETASEDYLTKFFGGFEALMSTQKKTTFGGHRISLGDRGCTISTLRSAHPKIWQFKTDVFTEVYNAGPSRTESLMVCTFPRNLNVDPE